LFVQYRYNKQYYIKGESSISDAEYDLLFNELSQLAQTHPTLVPVDSPLTRVGGAEQYAQKHDGTKMVTAEVGVCGSFA
jgi:NAD-dependent DNA ligase